MELMLPTGRVVGLPAEMADLWDIRRREVEAARDDVEELFRRLGEDGRRAEFEGRLQGLYRAAMEAVEQDPALDAVEQGLVRELAGHKLTCEQCRNAYCRRFNDMLRVFGGLALAALERRMEPQVSEALAVLPEGLRPAGRAAASALLIEAVRQVLSAMTGYALEAIINAARRQALRDVTFADIPRDAAGER